MGKVAVIGGYGSIGRRYSAILSCLGVKTSVYDINKPFDKYGLFEFLDNSGCERALICTPTDTHINFCLALSERKIPFLCEKPLTKDIYAAKDLKRFMSKHKAIGHVVNNYAFLLRRVQSLKKDSTVEFTEYSFFNTGKDGLLWDCCQLVYLNPNIDISTESPIWALRAGNTWVNYRDVELSYIEMIEAWLNQEYSALWSIDDGIKMSEAVLDRLMKEAVIEGIQ